MGNKKKIRRLRIRRAVFFLVTTLYGITFIVALIMRVPYLFLVGLVGASFFAYLASAVDEKIETIRYYEPLEELLSDESS